MANQPRTDRLARAPLGLRSVWTGANAASETYNFQTNTMYLCGLGSTPENCGVKVPKKDFSPRLGLAWRATPTFVVRAGFGINFDPNPLAWVRDFVGEAETVVNPSWPATIKHLPAHQLAQTRRTGARVSRYQQRNHFELSANPGLHRAAARVSYALHLVLELHLAEAASERLHCAGSLCGYPGDQQLQVMNVNVGAPGGGTASEPLYQAFGRTGSSGLIENYGRNS